MKAYIFTPGDLICRKGEVAREMFIIADGILEVIRLAYLQKMGTCIYTRTHTKNDLKIQSILNVICFAIFYTVVKLDMF